MPEVPHTLDAVRVGLHLANYLVDTGEVLNGHRGPLGGGGVTALWGTDVPGVGVEEGGWDCNLRHRGAHPGGGGVHCTMEVPHCTSPCLTAGVCFF
jgi:hypothetical protein